jgi:hypothetical protein
MKSTVAIACVTAVLKSRLENGLSRLGASASLGGDVIVSAQPPDRIAVGADERPQLNLFLHQVTPNTSRRGDRAAGTGIAVSRQTPALDLHYLLTAYGAHDYQIEVLLGYAVELMHAMQTLPRADFQATLAALVLPPQSVSASLFAGPSAALDAQIEQLAIMPQFLNTEELSRLWSALQARYRPSVAYKVSLVFTKERV